MDAKGDRQKESWRPELFKWFFVFIDDYTGFQIEVVAEITRAIDDVFGQQALQRAACSSAISDIHPFAVAMALQRFFEPFLIPGADFTDLVKVLVDDVDMLLRAARNELDDVERQKWFVPAAKRSTSDSLNHIIDLWSLLRPRAEVCRSS